MPIGMHIGPYELVCAFTRFEIRPGFKSGGREQVPDLSAIPRRLWVRRS